MSPESRQFPPPWPLFLSTSAIHGELLERADLHPAGASRHGGIWQHIILLKEGGIQQQSLDGHLTLQMAAPNSMDHDPIIWNRRLLLALMPYLFCGCSNNGPGLLKKRHFVPCIGRLWCNLGDVDRKARKRAVKGKRCAAKGKKLVSYVCMYISM